MPSMMPLMVMMFLILALYMIDGSNNVIGRILNYGLFILDSTGDIRGHPDAGRNVMSSSARS